MSVGETITEWIEQLREGDAVAAEKLWRCYFQRMVNLAQRRLDGAARAAADEEDVAASAFKSFCVGAREGRFPKLSDRDSLWSLLVAITAHKSVDLIRYTNRQKRGGHGGSNQDGPGRSKPKEPLSEIIQHGPTPEFVAQIGEQFRLLLNKLEDANDSDLLKIAIAKMQGASTPEVAKQLGCVRRTVERKILLIRRTWEQECQ